MNVTSPISLGEELYDIILQYKGTISLYADIFYLYRL